MAAIKVVWEEPRSLLDPMTKEGVSRQDLWAESLLIPSVREREMGFHPGLGYSLLMAELANVS
jgi:hypothetical protein